MEAADCPILSEPDVFHVKVLFVKSIICETYHLSKSIIFNGHDERVNTDGSC